MVSAKKVSSLLVRWYAFGDLSLFFTETLFGDGISIILDVWYIYPTGSVFFMQ